MTVAWQGKYHGMGRQLIVPVPHIKSAESGNKRLHAFCGTCGTPIYSSAVENPQSYGLRAGTIRQRAEFSPRRQIWRRSALPSPAPRLKGMLRSIASPTGSAQNSVCVEGWHKLERRYTISQPRYVGLTLGSTLEGWYYCLPPGVR
jgi:hypothetical protein